MRLTKVSVDAAMAAYIGVQKRGSETEHATLMRLMDEGDPTLSALYEESLTAPDPHRGTDLQKLHDHRAALQADITERAQEYMKTENPRRLSQRKRPLKISEAVAEVVGNDPALYEHWGGFPV